MDSERIITGAILLSFVLIPVVVLKIVSYARERKIIRLLHELAQRNNASLHEYDRWNNSAIGLDESRKQIFAINLDNGNLKSQVIDISRVHKCRVINDISSAAFKEAYFNVTNRIELELSDMQATIGSIKFYHVETDGPLLTSELVLAEKWCNLINEQVTRKVVPRIA